MNKAKTIICSFLCILLFITLSLYISTKIIEINNRDLLVDNRESINIKLDNINQIKIPEASNIAVFNYKLGRFYWIISIIASFVIPFFIIYTGVSGKIKNWSKNIGKHYIFIVALYIILLYTIYYVLSIPLDFFAGFYKGHLINLSNQSLSNWIAQNIKYFFMNLVIYVISGIFIYTVINHNKNYWPLILGVLSIPIMFIAYMITPVYIDPIFNDFKPLTDKKVEKRIEELTKKAGIDNCKLYEIDKSKETKAMNAYMTGILNTKRIVIWDNMLNNLNENEIAVVAAHEIGHYVLKHIPKSIVFNSVFITIVLFLSKFLSNYFIKIFSSKIKIYSISDLAAIPILILMVNLVTFLLAPIPNGYSRYHEMEADRFAIELTEDNYSNAAVEVKFLKNNISMPEVGTLYKLWRYDHPMPKERIEFSNSYKPWENNEPMKYQEYFRKK